MCSDWYCTDTVDSVHTKEEWFKDLYLPSHRCIRQCVAMEGSKPQATYPQTILVNYDWIEIVFHACINFSLMWGIVGELNGIKVWLMHFNDLIKWSEV